MEYNWLDLWERNQIDFHQKEGNSFLKKYWSALNLKPGADVFVPLCGKTPDLLWLAQQGYQVTGVELAEMACEAFFEENKLAYQVERLGSLKRYFNSQIQIFAGDFFALTKKELSHVDAVYDRAALIALPEELRKRYVRHLIRLMPAKSQILLIVYEANNTVQGPPYSVSQKEVQTLFAAQFNIIELERTKANFPQHLCKKGYVSGQTFNAVYHLQKESD